MTDTIKEWAENPWSWLSLVLVAGGGLWWANLTPSRANVTLIFIIFATTLSVVLLLRRKRLWLRVVAGTTVLCVLTFIVCQWFWTKSVPLEMHAETSEAVYPEDTKIGNVPWKPYYTPVRLVIHPSETDISDIDLVIQPDQPVAVAGQVSDIPNVRLSFGDLPRVSAEWIDRTTNQSTAMPVMPLACTRGYRLRCDLLPRRSRMEVVIAAVTVNDRRADREVDNLLAIRFPGGPVFWFAQTGHSERVFGPKPAVTTIKVNGEYTAQGRKHNIAKEMFPMDCLRNILTDGTLFPPHGTPGPCKP